MMADCNVFHKTLTESEARSLLSKGINRTLAHTKMERVAHVVGTCAKTIRNAHDEAVTLKMHNVFNLLAVDATALDDILAHFGKRVVDVDAATDAEARLLADTLALGAAHAEALADGIVDHQEEARLVKLARPVAQAWGGRVARSGRTA